MITSPNSKILNCNLLYGKSETGENEQVMVGNKRLFGQLSGRNMFDMTEQSNSSMGRTASFMRNSGITSPNVSRGMNTGSRSGPYSETEQTQGEDNFSFQNMSLHTENEFEDPFRQKMA